MYLTCNCLRETLALITGNKRLHDGIADPPRNGGSTELFIGVVLPLWDEQPTSAHKHLWMVFHNSMIVPKSP